MPSSPGRWPSSRRPRSPRIRITIASGGAADPTSAAANGRSRRRRRTAPFRGRRRRLRRLPAATTTVATTTAAPYGYYNPIPGRPYGGVRITGVPRDAQVFADGYYVGVVNDFDGIFQHLNLEAGPHHIEIVEPGLQPIAFDVIVRPGQTITYRAEMYGAYQPY